MKEFTVLICSMTIYLLSSKGIALGLVLLLFWLKGRQLGFQPKEWENYFLGLSQEKVLRIALGISGASISAASSKDRVSPCLYNCGPYVCGQYFLVLAQMEGRKGKGVSSEKVF